MRPLFRPRAVSAFGVGVLSLASLSSGAWADANTDRFQAWGRDQLEKPYHKAAFPCSSFAAVSKDYYVLDLPSWAAASGLRRGDRLIGYGGTSLTGDRDTDLEVWARMPRSEYVTIRVERAGKEVSLRLPCRDHREQWDEFFRLWYSIADGRWQDCIDAVSRTIRTAGYAPSAAQFLAITCIREKAKSERQRPPPDEVSRRIHAWATKAVEESHYRPSGLSEVRPQLLHAIETLEKAGRTTLADDIKQQIASFTQAPPMAKTQSEPKTVQRVGTAFAVRPDGFLVTAFHVVKSAKEIEISCPETGKGIALLEKFSEANDLAVLRMVERRTPTYLGIAAQRSVGLGEQVFTIGFPAPALLGGEAKFTEGVISSLSVAGDAGYMQISVPVQPGNSGGPLVNQSGEVVGVVVATASALSFLKGTGTLPQNVSWAVKGAFAAPLFDAPPASQPPKDRRAAVDRALRATCSVVATAEGPD